MTGDAQTAPEGQPLPVPLTVQVLDAGGRGVAGVTVDWKVTGPAAQARVRICDLAGLVCDTSNAPFSITP